MPSIETLLWIYAWPALLLVVGFGFVIFVHELGHFLVAKAVGVRVTQFAIGFGPSLFSWRKGLGFRFGSTESDYRKRVEAYLAEQGTAPPSEAPNMPPADAAAAPATVGNPPSRRDSDLDRADAALGLSETEYRVNLVFLLGGYVKMLGQEDMNPNAVSSDPRAFNRKPIWARAAVVSAGVVMNVIFGLLFFIAAFTHGVDFNAPVVGEVVPGTPAAGAFAQGHQGDLRFRGLRPGDEIVAVDHEGVHDLQDVNITAALGHPDEPIVLTVKRPRMAGTLQFAMRPQGGPQGLQWLGIEPAALPKIAQTVVMEALPASLRQQLEGVEPGMAVVAVGEQAVETFEQFNAAVAAGRGEGVPVTFANGSRVTVELRAQPSMMFELMDEAAVPHVLGLVPASTVAAVSPGSPAAEAGMQVGDILVRVNDNDWPAFHEVPAIVRQSAGAVQVTVLRAGEQVTLAPASTDRNGRLGFATQPTEDPIVVMALPGSPGAALRLTPGSRVLALNGQPVGSVVEMQGILWRVAAEHPEGFEVAVEYELNVKDKPREQATVQVPAALAGELASLEWSQPLPLALLEMQMVTLKGQTPTAAVWLGLVKTRQYMLQVYVTLVRLVQGSVPADQVQGPVGIFRTGTKLAERGWAYLLFFLGLISVNLAVINFLPIPIVDGGHILFLAIEKIKGSPVSEAVQTAALYVGLAIIVSVLLFTFYNDISRWAAGA